MSAATAAAAAALADAGNTGHSTVRKMRKTSKTPQGAAGENLTVEEHLLQQFEEMENKVRTHTAEKLQALQAEFNKMKSALLASAGVREAAYVVTLEAVEGPYTGKKWSHTLKLAPVRKGGKGKAKTDKSKVVTMPIGRSKAAKYVKSGVSLSKDDSVSTIHAEIRLVRGKGLFLEDRGSTNGTTVDDVELVAMTPVPLVDGQAIYFGSETKMVVDIQTAKDE